jgi:hypothetical protein
VYCTACKHYKDDPVQCRFPHGLPTSISSSTCIPGIMIAASPQLQHLWPASFKLPCWNSCVALNKTMTLVILTTHLCCEGV